MRQNKWKNGVMLAVTCLVVVFALWGPEALVNYSDRSALNQVTVEKAEASGEGYRYTLNNNEKLYILAKCLNSQIQPESERSALLRENADSVNYEELTGTYAFVINRQGPSEREITQEEIFSACNEELQKLQEQGILPDEVKEVTADAYSAVLYSAIDVLEPRNNVSVWKVSLSTGIQNANKAGRLLDAYVDADTGKFYEFYVRTSTVWKDMEPEKIVASWAEYMDLSAPEQYESENPLLENTPYFAKYRFAGPSNASTVVTVGFYDGINEFYLKISK